LADSTVERRAGDALVRLSKISGGAFATMAKAAVQHGESWADVALGGGEFLDVERFSPGMRDQNASRQQAVAALARRQHGVAEHGQLIRLGLSPSAIGRWVADGRLHRVHRGVYSVGHRLLTAHGRWMAGVLACGRSAVLSHQCAAALWDLLRSSSPKVHVTSSGRGSPRGLNVHRVRRLHPEDCTVVDGIPVTTVARTILDLAEALTPRQLIRVLEQAERLGVFDLIAIERVLARNPGRHGTKPLRAAIVAVHGEPPPFVNSEWERDFLDFCEDHDIPKPELNVIVEGFLVDAFWRDRNLIVELDSWRHHRSRRAFEEDRLKSAKLQLAGYLVPQITKLDDAAAELISAGVAAR
jgi:hypothetical protein